MFPLDVFINAFSTVMRKITLSGMHDCKHLLNDAIFPNLNLGSGSLCLIGNEKSASSNNVKSPKSTLMILLP